MKKVTLMLALVISLISLTFGCKIYNYYKTTEVLVDPTLTGEKNVGKSKYEKAKTYQEYLNSLIDYKLVEVAPDNSSIKINIILEGYSGEVYLYGDRPIISQIDSNCDSYGEGPFKIATTPNHNRRFAKLASPTKCGELDYYLYTVTIPVKNDDWDDILKTLPAGPDNTKVETYNNVPYNHPIGTYFFHFTKNTLDNDWAGLKREDFEKWLNAKGGKPSGLSYVFDDNGPMFQLRLCFSNTTGAFQSIGAQK